MLLSPAKIHDDLSSITSTSDTSYPHTAMLITPAGQIMSWVSTPPGYDYYDQDPNNDHENGDSQQEGDEEEPWLDTPERLRLILGLVAEFTEGTVSKVESEVSLSIPSPADQNAVHIGKCELIIISLESYWYRQYG
jgi:hypothetical protein